MTPPDPATPSPLEAQIRGSVTPGSGQTGEAHETV